MRAAIGLDIGGTKIAGALVDDDGVVRELIHVPTPAAAGPDAVLATAAGLAEQLAVGAPVPPLACGVGTAGAVDARGRVTHATTTLPGWTGTDVRSRLSSRLGLPVTVHNDVHAMALGEARFGAAAGEADALVVAVGTGVGGALVANGALLAGRHGFAGSIGHLPAVRRDGRTCGCGLRDHVEAYAAGPAIVAAYAARTGGRSRTLAEIGAAAAAGDPHAARVIAEAAEVLGVGLAAAVNLIDPTVVVLGGGVTGLGPALLGPAEAAMRATTLPGPDRIPVRPAALGPAAAVAGAAVAALDASAGGDRQPHLIGGRVHVT